MPLLLWENKITLKIKTAIYRQRFVLSMDHGRWLWKRKSLHFCLCIFLEIVLNFEKFITIIWKFTKIKLLVILQIFNQNLTKNLNFNMIFHPWILSIPYRNLCCNYANGLNSFWIVYIFLVFECTETKISLFLGLGKFGMGFDIINMYLIIEKVSIILLELQIWIIIYS